MTVEASAPYAAIVAMGVAGSGKTTIGHALARRLGWRFVDADDLHPPANIAKMAVGQPLDDADRAPWLAAVRATIDAARASETPLVMACSALKRSYRTQIGGDADDVAVVYLHGAPELLRRRLLERQGHFMGARMLDSQLATLEPPAPDEDVIAIDVAAAPAAIIDRILTQLAARARSQPGQTPSQPVTEGDPL